MIEELEYCSTGVNRHGVIHWERHPDLDDIVNKVNELVEKINELERIVNEGKAEE